MVLETNSCPHTPATLSYTHYYCACFKKLNFCASVMAPVMGKELVPKLYMWCKNPRRYSPSSSPKRKGLWEISPAIGLLILWLLTLPIHAVHYCITNMSAKTSPKPAPLPHATRHTAFRAENNNNDIKKEIKDTTSERFYRNPLYISIKWNMKAFSFPNQNI